MAAPAKGPKLTRAKTHDQIHVDTGKGVPQIVSKALKKGHEDKVTIHRRSGARTSFRIAPGSSKKSIITNLSQQLNLDEYEFPDEDLEDLSGAKADIKMDVTALDRYSEDIRRLRKICIEECRLLPHRGDLDDHTMKKITLIVRCLCRSAYYGTHKAQVLAEGANVLIIWLLNRRNISTKVKVHILQSLAEMFWSSSELKLALYRCNGVKLIAKLLANGVKNRSDQGQWACYMLAMASSSSVEIIETIKNIDSFDEIVGEISFYPYWVNWPANFGAILQGILYGPHSVIPLEDTYEFV